MTLAVLEGTSSKTKKAPAGNLSVIPAGVLPKSVDTSVKGGQIVPLLFCPVSDYMLALDFDALRSYASLLSISFQHKRSKLAHNFS